MFLCVCVFYVFVFFVCDVGSGATFNDVPDGDTPCNGAFLALSQRLGEIVTGCQ